MISQIINLKIKEKQCEKKDSEQQCFIAQSCKNM